MWTLDQIWIYPIKSLPGLSVSQSEILPAGNLQHDREFALFDAEDRIVNAKRTAAFHKIRATWNLPAWSVGLWTEATPNPDWFHLDQDRDALCEWLSEALTIPVRIEQQPVGGFPDDREASGPTVVTTATLAAVAEWFPGLSVDEVRRRFRANLELDGNEAFSEDRLFSNVGEHVEFTVGEAMLLGSNPCQRCVVPSRSSISGEILPVFQKKLAGRRQAELPEWANRSRFDHYYRLAVNTRVCMTKGSFIQAGDKVQIECEL